MEFRNAIFLADNISIDCEINHLTHGWIPFTAIAGDKGTDFDVDALIATMTPVAVPYSPTPAAQVLRDAKALKRNEIRLAFALAAEGVVTDDPGRRWNGGFDSAIKMDAAKRMAQLAGLTSVVLFDDANVAHTLNFAEAEAVILTIGADYQTKFSQKQALMSAVDAAVNAADLDAIVVSF